MALLAPMFVNGCRLGHFAHGFVRQMAHLAPMFVNGCRLGRFAHGFVCQMAHLAPIFANGCRLAHFAPEIGSQMARLAPITGWGCRMGVVWDAFASKLGRRWHVWHPLLMMGADWAAWWCACTLKRFALRIWPWVRYSWRGGGKKERWYVELIVLLVRMRHGSRPPDSDKRSAYQCTTEGAAR